MPTTIQMRVATVVIVLVLGLQFFADISQSNKWTWPFTDYPMYTQSHHEGDRIAAYPVLIATTEDGGELQISPEDVHLNMYQFASWMKRLIAANQPPPTAPPAHGSFLHRWLKSTGLVARLKGTNNEFASPDITNAILATYQRQFGKRIVRLRIEDTGAIVTRAGMKEVPREVLAEIDVPTNIVETGKHR